MRNFFCEFFLVILGIVFISETKKMRYKKERFYVKVILKKSYPL
jgi:hypothetical protein